MQVNDLASSSSSSISVSYCCTKRLFFLLFFFVAYFLHTQLVKNVIIFRFDQSYEQPMLMMVIRYYMYIYVCMIDRQIDR